MKVERWESKLIFDRTEFFAELMNDDDRTNLLYELSFYSRQVLR